MPPLKSLAAAAAGRAPVAMRAAALMVVAMICFTVMSAIIRHLSGGLSPFEIAFFRNFFGLVALAPWFWQHGLAGLKTRRHGLFALRGLMGPLNMWAWFYALSLMPLGDVMALSFTAPLFATIAAVLFLREVVRGRRWTATAIGFLGTLIIVRPGAGVLEPGALLVLFSSAMLGLNVCIVKVLARTEKSGAIVAYMGIYLAPITLIPALFVWQWPTLEQALWLIAVGLAGNANMYGFARAFRIGDASLAMPFDFIRLPFTALVGYLAFAQQPDLWVWIGAAVIFTGSAYVTHREALAQRRAAADGGKAP